MLFMGRSYLRVHAHGILPQEYNATMHCYNQVSLSTILDNEITEQNRNNATNARLHSLSPH